jgi:hypothetical protein
LKKNVKNMQSKDTNFIENIPGLKSRIGNPVNFSHPVDVKNKGGIGNYTGKILEEEWVVPKDFKKAKHSNPCVNKNCWGDYVFASQLIEWDDPKTPNDIRLTYFRRKCGEANWKMAGQTTITGNVADIKKLLESTLARKDWFK